MSALFRGRAARDERPSRRYETLQEPSCSTKPPGRVTQLLTDLEALLGPRSACVLREMTKLHEEHKADTLGQLAAWARGRRFKGELTIVVGGERGGEAATLVTIASLAPRFAELRSDGLSARDAAKKLAKEHGLSTRDVYNKLATHGTLKKSFRSKTRPAGFAASS